MVEVRYPAETPELPPVVFGPAELLDRHQNPFEGNFCLLERPLDDWKAHDWGAADLVVERLGALLNDTEAGPDAVRAAEAPMPEPFSEYYSTALGPVVIVPGDLLSPQGNQGVAKLQLFDPSSLRLIMVANDGQSTSCPIPDAFKQGHLVDAKWKRVDVPPRVPDATSMVRWVRAEQPDLLAPPLPRKLAGSRHLKQRAFEVVGILFPEEGPAVGETRDAWIFLYVPREGEPHLIEHQVLSHEERSRRIPDLVPLTEKQVLVLGLGTLGGSIALELARAGVGALHLVDFDRVDVNNSVRHVLTTDFSGLPKTLALAAVCRRANPFGRMVEHQLRLGDAEWTGDSSLERLIDLIPDVDLVVETTGSHQIHRLLGRLCFEGETPFVSCWLTDGYLGGHASRIIPGRTQCYLCFATSIARGELPLAEAAEDAAVTAQGCSHPTSTGAGFNASELAAATSRLVVDTLLNPDTGDDHFVMNFYRGSNDALHPRIVTAQLPPNTGCDRCQPNAGSTKLLSTTS